MIGHKNTVIITDRYDGENLYKLSAPVTRLLCLSNEARHILQCDESKIVSVLDTFNSHDQARCAAATRRFDRLLNECLVDSELEHTTVANVVYNRSSKLLTKGFVFRRMLHKFPRPWYIFNCGEWQEFNCDVEAVQTLLQKTKKEYYFDFDLEKNNFAALLNTLESNLTRAIARKHKGVPKILISKTIKPKRTKFKPLLDLQKSLQKSGIDIDFICLRPKPSVGSNFQHLILQTYRLFKSSQVDNLYIPVVEDQTIANSAIELLDDIYQKVEFSSPLEPWLTDIAKTGAYFQCVANSIVKYMDDLSPFLSICELGGQTGLDMAIKEACYRTQTPIVFLPHGAYAQSNGSIGKWCNQYHFYLNQLREAKSGEILLKHPQEEKIINEIIQSGRISSDVKVSKVRIYSETIAEGSKTKALNTHPTLLYAGASVEWSRYYCPWITQTDDEFIQSIVYFCRLIQELPQIRMIVRPKKVYSGLTETIPEDSNIVVTTDGEFQDVLANCDALISNRSTTILEALVNRKPVILWSITGNYIHYPSRSSPPTSSEDRAAVYTLQPHHENPTQFIESILQWHVNSPLTDSELEEYVWPKNVNSFESVVRRYIVTHP